jgi:hypothetical protein
MKSYKQIFAIKKANEARIKKLCPEITKESGIYVFTRTDEGGIKYAYVGQAKNLLQRTAEHLAGYQHIDLSIKKHGLYDEAKNCYGWRLHIQTICPAEMLDEAEQKAVRVYAFSGYQLRNDTTGGQGEGKKSLHDYGKGGYLKGKREGEAKAYKAIGVAINKYTTGLRSKGGKIADRKTAELIEKLNPEIDFREE